MSHFLVAVYIDPPEDLEPASAAAATRLVEQERAAGTIFYDAPIQGDGKVLRTYAEGAAGELLAPYNENLEVEPYETDCHCVGDRAELRAEWPRTSTTIPRRGSRWESRPCGRSPAMPPLARPRAGSGAF